MEKSLWQIQDTYNMNILKQVCYPYLPSFLRKRARNTYRSKSKMAAVAMATRQKLQFVSIEIVFLTKINIPAKFKENWLKAMKIHIYQFNLALMKHKLRK